MFNELGINVRRHDQRRLLLLHLLTESKGATHAEFQIDEEHEEMLIPALRYMYGFTFPREGEAEMPTSLYEVARFGALARRFGISDLEKWASDTANSLLNVRGPGSKSSFLLIASILQTPGSASKFTAMASSTFGIMLSSSAMSPPFAGCLKLRRAWRRICSVMRWIGWIEWSSLRMTWEEL
jgi:hypothetical protein